MRQPARQTKRLGNINSLLLVRIEETGVEIKKSSKEDSRVRVSRVNPLERMFNDGKLTRQEFSSGQDYQKNFTTANRDGFAKPSLIFDGLPDSARSTKPFEATPSQDKIDASRYITKIKTYLSLAANYKCIDFKWKEQRYPEILEYIFEQEIAVKNVEKLIGLNHRFIEERVKEICEILLKL